MGKNDLENMVIERFTKMYNEALSRNKIADFLKEYHMSDLIQDTTKLTGKIAIIGEAKFKELQVIGYCKTLGISKEQLEFELDYKTLKNRGCSKYQYNNNYSAILVGPLPHSMKDKGCYSSLIARMEQEDGFPPVIRVGFNDLKMSLTAVKVALKSLIEEPLLQIA